MVRPGQAQGQGGGWGAPAAVAAAGIHGAAGGDEGGLGALEEADDPLDEMGTVEAAVLKRMMAASRAFEDGIVEED